MTLTRLSLSLGGSWGSEAALLGGGGGEAGLGFSVTGAVSTFAFGFSSTFSAGGGGWEAASSDAFFGGAAPSADFEIIATFVPGSTVSPSFATNYQ